MYILGIWDGHDSGAALINDNKVIFAANEERYTKRKLEVAFPRNAIMACLDYAQIKPSDITDIAFTTTEFTKTLERLFPAIKENYYQMRRRKVPKPAFEEQRRKFKYSITTMGRLPLCGATSRYLIGKQLSLLGFRNFKLHEVEHHMAHAACAAFTAPFDKALIITIDGLGDGLCGTISSLENSKLQRHVAIGARDSIGIFYEQVTTVLGMRELEDEGKVMAMADYSFPFDYEKNAFKNFFSVVGTTIKARYSPSKQYELISRIAWQLPREHIAYMAQQLFENVFVKFTLNAIDRFNIPNVAFAGGAVSNIKANMKVRQLEPLHKWYVFPHMGDGGIALGSALYVNYLLNGITSYKDFTAYLGDEFTKEQIEHELKKNRMFNYSFEQHDGTAKHAAELIIAGNYLLWFNGRMEFGPRALGNRSIIAAADSEQVKELLNLHVKMREWFQPFAPSLLEDDAAELLEYDDKGTSKFMTMAYAVKPHFRQLLHSAIHVDGTARPHCVGSENKPYQMLLQNIKRVKGYGAVLNTSMNIHGMPIVRTPQDALEMMKTTKTKYMFIDGFFVENRKVQ